MSTQTLLARNSKAQNTILRAEKYTTLLSRFLNGIAGAGLILMLVLVLGDIIGIKIFSTPIPGGIEVVAFLGVVVIGFAIAWNQVIHGHIQVDFLIMKLPPRAKAVLEVLMTLLGMALFILLAWRSWDYGQVMRAAGEVSMTKRIPFYPFIWGLAFCYLATFLVLIVDLLKSIMKVGKRWNQ